MPWINLVVCALLEARSPSVANEAVAWAKSAVRRAGLDGNGDARFSRRARHAPWLPSLQLSFGRVFGTRETIYPPELDTQLRRVDDVRIEARASWQLDRLLYDAQELEILRERRLSASRRRELEEKVIELYFERKRLLEMPPADPETLAARRLRIGEVDALLVTLAGPEVTHQAIEMENDGQRPR